MTALQDKKPATRLFIGCVLIAIAVSGCTSTGKNTDDSSVASNEAGTNLDDDGEMSLDEDGFASADSANESSDAVAPDLASEELSDDLDKELDAEMDAAEPKATQTAAAEPDSSDELTLDDEPVVAEAQPETVAQSEEPLEAPLELEDAPSPVAEAAPVEAAPVAETTPEVVPEPAVAQEPTVQGIKLTDLRYVAKQNGGTVVIQTSEPATYQTREVPSQNQVVIEIANAQLPEKFKRPYVTKDFGQSIASINAYQDPGSTTVRVVVQLKAPTRANVQQSGASLSVTAGQALQAGTEVASAPSEDMADSETAQQEGEMTDSESPNREFASTQDPRILPAAQSDTLGGDNVRFYGRPISLEVRDTPVREVINLIAEQSGANIVLASEVDGNISLKLRQIPWDQALLIVMKTRNLGYSRQGSILRIAPYEALQKESEAARRVVDAQRAAEPLRVKVIPVGYAKVDNMQKHVEPFLTKERGKIVADDRTNSLVVTDTPDVLERVANLVKALDLPPLQVLIEGKVVEARETFARDFGVNWGASGGNGINLGGDKMLNTNLSVSTGQFNGGLNLGIQLGTLDVLGDLTATLGLLERDDIVKVVSSPRVVALNNEQASILQGTNIGIVKSNDTPTGRTTSFEYVPIEMRLEVTPQVTSENDIILNVNIKREFAANRLAGAAPDINKREAKTKVLVRNGETAVVGGVYQSDTNEAEAGVPWLRNIPVIGWLFKGRSVSNEKNELLVFLTPRILNAEKVQKENTL